MFIFWLSGLGEKIKAKRSAIAPSFNPDAGGDTDFEE
jgi:hypothetical protein